MQSTFQSSEKFKHYTMKEQVRITKEGTDVTIRFLQALMALKEQKRILGIKTFARKYDINAGNFNVVLHYPESHNVKIEHVVYLLRDFGVSANWLILGEGNMFNS